MNIRFISFHKLLNYLQLVVSYCISVLTRRAIVWGKPASFSLEPTNVCNLDCKECPTNKVNTPKGMLTVTDARIILEKCAPTAFHVSLFFQGEPFMNEYITEIITHAHQLKIATTVSTNGHFITDQLAQRIVESKLWRIIISIDGYDQASYAQYRSGGQFNTVVQAIETIAQAKHRLKSNYPIIEAQCLILSTTEKHLETVKQIALKAGANKVRYKTAQIYEYEKGSILMPLYQKSRYQQLPNGSYQIKSKLPNRCWRLWHTMVINWQGIAIPCCFDKDWNYSIDSLVNKDITAVWKHRQFMQFRNKVLQQRAKIDMCKNCTSGLHL